VILEARAGVDTLLDLAGRHHHFAEDGEPGGGKQMHGRDGADVVVVVPPGTLVYDDVTGELIEDLKEPGQRIVVARGGRGGFGNEHFKSPTNQTPRQATPGEPGEERTLRLELKLIADVGLVGKPNAGKSTLLSRVSKARPKIADYPFTTLEPNLGIAVMPGEKGTPRRLVIADIPGLIEGASQGTGLGMRFLRHIERTRVLVHLLEADPMDGSTPLENYQVVRHELAEYSQELAEKPELVVVSKIDLVDEQTLRERIAPLEEALGRPVLKISAATNQGLSEMLEACWRIAKA